VTVGRSVLIAHPSADLYGSDRVMLETVEAMAERGWHVTVTLPGPGPLVEEVERRGALVRYCPTPVLRTSFLTPTGLLKMVGQTLRSIPRSVGLIRRSQADMVYVSTLTIPLWLPIGRLLRRPVVCHVHESERSVHPVIRRALAAPLLLATALIVNSEYSRGVLTESFRRLGDRSEVIYNGVPGPVEVLKARDVLEQPIRLLFVGRLAPRKGPQVAVELVRMLADRGVDSQLEVLGSVFPGYEWFEDELRSAAAATDHSVAFSGFDPDVWSHVAAADVVLVPSQGDEPFGNTAVEAVLAARPVVVSASSGLDEAVAGYTSAHSVPATDLEAWVGAVVEVVDGWGEYRNRAWDDAATAAQRHSPELYRERIEHRLSELSRA
jgi:glycosyltransferase involved in cell wall biosynthesis